jgi:hypothetical protein
MMTICGGNKQSYYHTFSFLLNERVGMSELYEAKWNSKNDNKSDERRREQNPWMKEK